MTPLPAVLVQCPHCRGVGRVAIGTSLDALAVLNDEPSNEPMRAIYIRTGDPELITSIPQGDYRLRFQFANRWLRDGRFCELSGTSEFLEVFEFTEEKDERQGTARTQRMADVPLLLPPE